MSCSEWWSFEVAVIEAGYLGAIPIDAHIIVLNILYIAYSFPLGFSIAASTRVGNCLGAGKEHKAKMAAKCVNILFLFTVIIYGLIFFFIRKIFIEIYTNDSTVIELATSLAPLAAVIMLFDGIQGICAGILRGLGYPIYGAIFNLISYWVFGIPTGFVLTFIFSFGVYGLWWGTLLAQLIVDGTYFTFFILIDWKKAAIKAQSLANNKLEEENLNNTYELSEIPSNNLELTRNDVINKEEV